MIITTEDEHMKVTIEDKTGKVDLDSLVDLFRYSALAHGFHADNVSALIPREHELDEIIFDAIKVYKDESFLDKEVDNSEIEFDTTA